MTCTPEESIGLERFVLGLEGGVIGLKSGVIDP